jgi:hypothetical protein
VLDGIRGARELDAAENVTEAAIFRENEAIGLALDPPEARLLPAISDEETRDRPISFQGEPPPRGHLVESRLHSESRDFAAVRVEPGLAASLIEEKRASARRIEGAEPAGQREVPPVPVAVGVVQEVESQPPPQELRVGVQDLAGRAVRPLRQRERDLLAQTEEVLLLDRHAVVGLSAGAAQVARQLRRPRVPRAHDDVDLIRAAGHWLPGDRHRPEKSQETQVPLGLHEFRRVEKVPLREEELAADDLRSRGAVNRVGDPTEEVRLGVLEDVFALDPDAPDPRSRLRSGGGREIRPHENAQQKCTRPEEPRSTQPRTRIVPEDAA